MRLDGLRWFDTRSAAVPWWQTLCRNWCLCPSPQRLRNASRNPSPPLFWSGSMGPP